MKSVVCFGEVLWDILPTGQQPGGAPFNVAVHLQQLGQPAQLISRVGDDELGRELLDFIASKGLSTDYVQQGKTHLTGIVKVNVDDANEVGYKIVQPVAWDYIQYTEELGTLVAEAEMLVFGTLACRQADTRKTLKKLLDKARCRVFDLNLRPPHYTRDLVRQLLGKADIVKLNHHELAEIMPWFGDAATPDRATAMRWLAERYQLQAVCVTCGAEGAMLFTGGQLYTAPGLVIDVRDTIGSGDAFLAALLRGWLRHDEPGEMLRFACAAGALVATHQGATPAIAPADVEAMMR